ncbi:cytochrome p450 protein [Diaporthe eres]|nr:cytochrome p450 protein [Diaporthe eres]
MYSTMIGMVTVLVACVAFVFVRPARAPRNMPIVGMKPGDWFPLFRAGWRNTLDFKKAVSDAYAQHKDEACFIPMAGAPDHVLLPPAELQWLLDQPDSVFSITEYTSDTLQTNHTFSDGGLLRWPVHMELIPRKLAREAMNLIPQLVDEIETAMNELWGDRAGETREVCVYTSMQRAIGRATNRVLVGLPLCRNDVLLENGAKYAMSLPMAAVVLRFLCGPLKHLFAPLLNIPSYIFRIRFYNVIRDEIRDRLTKYDLRTTSVGTKTVSEPNNDFLQWCIHQAKTEYSGNPYLGQIDTLAGRILILNLASIHTSSFAMTHALLDLAFAGSEGQGFISELRSEIEDVLARHGGNWSKHALADMPKVDSVLRESQRLNSFVTIGVGRSVVAKGGVTTPWGTHLPQGIKVATHTYPVMRDPAFYDFPDKFRPFRFSQGEENCTGKTRLAFTTTSNEYFAFGAGRHACPGRVFASCELRLMLACIIMHYDFELAYQRPKNAWFALHRIPNMQATIRVTRRSVC